MVNASLARTGPAVLVDGTNLLLRVVHSRFRDNSLLSERELAESCALIFLKLLTNEVKKYAASRLYLFFDSGGSSRKTSILSSYKTNRKVVASVSVGIMTPSYDSSDIFANLLLLSKELTLSLCRQFNLSIFMEPGIEADDAIGIVVEELAKLGKQVVVISNDSDFFQLLVYPSVICYVPYKSSEVTKNNFTQFFSSLSKSKGITIHPNEYLAYKAIVGDLSDNISGIPRIGYKTLNKKLSAQLESESSELVSLYLHDSLEYFKRISDRNTTEFDKLINANISLLIRNYSLIDLSSKSVSSHTCILAIKKLGEVYSKPSKLSLMTSLKPILSFHWESISPISFINNTLFSFSSIYY